MDNIDNDGDSNSDNNSDADMHDNSDENSGENSDDVDDTGYTQNTNWDDNDNDSESDSDIPKMVYSSSWSHARKKAWRNRDKNKNEYYYRFNENALVVRKGKWKKKEFKQFMLNIKKFGVNKQWGMFSKNIKRRAGYQCSNKWRELIKSGMVKDYNYTSAYKKNKKTGKMELKLQFIRSKNKNFSRYAFEVLNVCVFICVFMFLYYIYILCVDPMILNINYVKYRIQLVFGMTMKNIQSFLIMLIGYKKKH